MSHLEDIGWRASFEADLARLGDASLEPARVIEEQKGSYRVATESADRAASLAGRLRHGVERREELPAVGDWVALRIEGGSGAIRHVLARTSALIRRAAGRETAAQVVAANVDVVLVVVALDRGFRPGAVERALALVWESGASPVLVLNKSDLCADLGLDPQVERAKAAASAPGVPVVLASALEGTGVEALAPHLAAGRTGVVVGQSGAGKSTLVNRLLEREAQPTGAVREWDSRGRHTTTARELHRLPRGGVLIDTPGMRELGLWGGEEGLGSAFPDIEELAATCAYRDCAHAAEPGCAVRAAVADGTLDGRRLESFVKLGREIAYQERRRDLHARSEEKKRRKRVARERRRWTAEEG